MHTIVQELGQLLAQIPGFTVRFQPAAMIVTLPVGLGRTQTVKVTTHQGKYGTSVTLRLQSRACIVNGSATVAAALRANSNLEWGGLALDTSTTPPVIDVIYHLIANDLDRNYFLTALENVAKYADSLERGTSGTDLF